MAEQFMKEEDAGGGGLILIVEDEPEIRELLRDLLVGEGYLVETAEDGTQALDNLRHGPPPALILLDLSMPRMNGWQLREEMREDPGLDAVPVVLLSADQRVRDWAEQMHAAGWLAKPPNFRNLLRVVERYCPHAA